MSEIDLKHFILSVLKKYRIKTKVLQNYFQDKKLRILIVFLNSTLVFVAFHEKLKSQKINKAEIVYMHPFKHLCYNSRNTFLKVIIFASQPTLNLLYCSTIL